MAQAADVPLPPPLEESVDENLYREYISTSTTPVPQVFSAIISTQAHIL